MSPVPGPVSPRPGLKGDLRRIGQLAVREHMRANARPIAATDNYGWTFDPGASEHASLCPWVIPTGTTVAEVARPQTKRATMVAPTRTARRSSDLRSSAPHAPAACTGT